MAAQGQGRRWWWRRRASSARWYGGGGGGGGPRRGGGGGPRQQRRRRRQRDEAAARRAAAALRRRSPNRLEPGGVCVVVVQSANFRGRNAYVPARFGTLVPVCATNRYQRVIGTGSWHKPVPKVPPGPPKLARESPDLWYRLVAPTGTKGFFSFLFLFSFPLFFFSCFFRVSL